MYETVIIQSVTKENTFRLCRISGKDLWIPLSGVTSVIVDSSERRRFSGVYGHVP